MDPSLYKSVKTSRGLTYSYWTSTAQDGKPTLLFCHGFPSTSRDWRYIAPVLKDKGYGVIVPDMLGYGDTDKPTDPALYVSSKVSQDLVDILDAEGIDKAVAVGFDWGSKNVSRLASYHPDRFIAYAFLAVPFIHLGTFENHDNLLATHKEANGYETFGYFQFFASDEAETIIRDHIDAFARIVFPHDPTIWMTKLTPIGALKTTLLEDHSGPLPSYVTQEDLDEFKKTFLKNGMAGPLCWYKKVVDTIEHEDEAHVPADHALPPKSAPLFFGAAKNDYISVAAFGYSVFGNEEFKEHSVTIRDFDADHWLILSKGSEIARELGSWIEGTVAKVLL
ncbi:hypothetical protein NM688_g2016 [Phlebia brevispora]|uniref:Uncharacterized protein n=1 Tax=Phlebia brevispora TaxID=194682 RepID=A0ACC1TAH3_9APHY|nr:hypothetical protein NM688_g2016 [Phlebia brevispora]